MTGITDVSATQPKRFDKYCPLYRPVIVCMLDKKVQYLSDVKAIIMRLKGGKWVFLIPIKRGIITSILDML